MTQEDAATGAQQVRDLTIHEARPSGCRLTEPSHRRPPLRGTTIMSATTPTATPTVLPEDVTEVGTDVAVRTDPRAVIAALVKGEATVYSSFTGTAFDDKIKVLQALTDTVPIADHLGEVINLENVLVQGVDIADPKSGDAVTAPRVILVDADGTAYAGVSSGLLRSLENIFSILGQPASWDKPLACSVVEQRARSGFKFFTIKTV